MSDVAASNRRPLVTLILPLLLSFQFAVTPEPSVAHRELPRIVANEIVDRLASFKTAC